jgi:hypothetical protein
MRQQPGDLPVVYNGRPYLIRKQGPDYLVLSLRGKTWTPLSRNKSINRSLLSNRVLTEASRQGLLP